MLVRNNTERRFFMSSKSENNDFNYKTPLKKLVHFFRDSRDKWKARSINKQKRIDFLETRVKDLTNSRNKWKQKAKVFLDPIKRVIPIRIVF